MTIEDAKKQVKDLLDRLDASSVSLQSTAPALSRERKRDHDAIKMMLGGQVDGLALGDGSCPMCGV